MELFFIPVGANVGRRWFGPQRSLRHRSSRGQYNLERYDQCRRRDCRQQDLATYAHVRRFPQWTDFSSRTSTQLKLQGRNLAATVARERSDDRVELFVAAQWEPTSITSGTVTAVATGNGLLGGTISSSGTLTVDVGTTANKILQLSPSAQIPAVDGFLVTNVNAVKRTRPKPCRNSARQWADGRLQLFFIAVGANVGRCWFGPQRSLRHRISRRAI